MLRYSIIDRRGQAEYSVVSAEATDCGRDIGKWQNTLTYIKHVHTLMLHWALLVLWGHGFKIKSEEQVLKNQSHGYLQNEEWTDHQRRFLFSLHVLHKCNTVLYFQSGNKDEKGFADSYFLLAFLTLWRTFLGKLLWYTIHWFWCCDTATS